jgi:alpha-tubulin suppressor-like RCC1 family protein
MVRCRSTSSPLNTPIQGGSDSNWTVAAEGSNYTCALRSDETTWCLGYNWEGELGNDHSWVETGTAILP